MLKINYALDSKLAPQHLNLFSAIQDATKFIGKHAKTEVSFGEGFTYLYPEGLHHGVSYKNDGSRDMLLLEAYFAGLVDEMGGLLVKHRGALPYWTIQARKLDKRCVKRAVYSMFGLLDQWSEDALSKSVHRLFDELRSQCTWTAIKTRPLTCSTPVTSKIDEEWDDIAEAMDWETPAPISETRPTMTTIPDADVDDGWPDAIETSVAVPNSVEDVDTGWDSVAAA